MHQDNYVRGESLLNSMVEKCTVKLRHLGDDNAEERGYGRFLHNNKITTGDLLLSYRPPVPDNIAQMHVLMAEDTSEISFGLDSGKTGLGKVGNGGSEGFFCHPTIGLDASTGGCLGLAALQIYLRKEYEPTKSEIAKARKSLEKGELKRANKKGIVSQPISEKRVLRQARETHQKTLPFEAKDRYRWLETALEAAKYYKDAAQRTVICDREGDIFQALMGFYSQNLGFVVRSSHNRYLDYTRSELTLHSEAEKWSEECCHKVKLPKTDKRTAHEAILQVSYGQVNIACPESLLKYELPLSDGQKIPMLENLPVYAVRVFESPDSVINNEQPIEWLLLTSIPVLNAEQALQIVQYYRWRWVIEQVFRSLKSKGLDIESSNIQKGESLMKLSVLALIAATQIMQLVQARDGKTNQEIQAVFDDCEIQAIQQLNSQLEGKTEKQKNPYPPQSLAFAVWVIARLGGWKPYASPKPPGPITILNGFTTFYNVMIGFRLKLEPIFQ